MNLLTWEDLASWWGWIVAGLLLYPVVAALAWRAGQKLLPPQREQRVPWSAFEILLVFYTIQLLIPLLVSFLFVSTPLGEALYGNEVMKLVNAKDESEERKLARNRVEIAP